MRLRVSEILTLDGVMEAPDHWVFQYMDQEIGEDVMAAAWPSRTGDMADRFNSVPKYVVSSTLRDVTWNNSHVITGNIAEEVAKLKAQPSGILLVNGSADLVQLLAQHHLIDEYYFSVAPLVLGKGKRLFQEGEQARLQLVNSKAYKTGMLRLGYEPIKQ